jgi:DNA-cytosine methyltransferase
VLGRRGAGIYPGHTSQLKSSVVAAEGRQGGPLLLADQAASTRSLTALARWGHILLVEDNSARSVRRAAEGVDSIRSKAEVVVRVHRISRDGVAILAEAAYSPGGLPRHTKRAGKGGIALGLLDRIGPASDAVVVGGPEYGCNQWFVEGVLGRGLSLVAELRPKSLVAANSDLSANSHLTDASKLLDHAEWREYHGPATGGASEFIRFAVAALGAVRLPSGRHGRLFAAERGAIAGVHRGTVIGFTSTEEASLEELLQAIGWTRWIRPLVRRVERAALDQAAGPPADRGGKRRANGDGLKLRANITLARRHDQAAASLLEASKAVRPLRGLLASNFSTLNVAELFAGAGGMGLGFLLAKHPNTRYRLVFSGEVQPIFVETLRRNHEVLGAQSGSESVPCVPDKVAPVDLRQPQAADEIKACARNADGIQVLIGGPPCQGFSNANRNSWHSSNPHNNLIDVFLDYVVLLAPQVFLLENVQGIHWTLKHEQAVQQPSVLEHVERRMKAAGYQVFTKLLDAVWYGVPQYRSRFFILGIHRDLGYDSADFGPWGPFPQPSHAPGGPRPYVTVRDAIADLPEIPNGCTAAETPYRDPSEQDLRVNEFLSLVRAGAPGGVVSDHVTSRHADYVIERYRRIPPGGNWQNIVDSLTNYADVRRTHSNIYRRLVWDEPSITVGHYRKSMLVHPSQHRGLSLREASRLQSFPDWFRFAGRTDGWGGLVHKQQQLANAVCPLVTKAIAELILGL